jgi:hypothetical protein
MTTEALLNPDAAPQAVQVELKAETPKDGVPPVKIIPPQEGIDDLKKELEESKKRQQERLDLAQRQIAEAAARAAEESKRANAAEARVLETQRDAVGTTVDLLTKERESAKRDYADAMQAGDFGKAADAQERMSIAAARLVKAEEGRLALEDDLKRRDQPEGRRPDGSNLSSAEKLARNMEQQGNIRSAAWVREHPEYVNDPSLAKKVEQAHFYALGEGYAEASDAYFQAVNSKLGLNGQSGERTQRQEDTSRSAAPLSAPVSRQSQGYQPGRMPSRITLSAEQAQTARELGMTAESYAKQLWALVEEGKIDAKNLNVG